MKEFNKNVLLWHYTLIKLCKNSMIRSIKRIYLTDNGILFALVITDYCVVKLGQTRPFVDISFSYILICSTRLLAFV